MSLCIAALSSAAATSRSTQRAIFSTDHRIENERASHDVGVKAHWLDKRWIALTAGKLAATKEVVQYYQADFARRDRPLNRKTAIPFLEKPLIRLRNHFADRYLREHTTLSLVDFTRNGQHRLSPALYSAASHALISRENLPDADLLLVGWLGTRFGIYRGSSEGVRVCDNDFGAIGTGADMAEAAMYRRNLSARDPFGRTVYGVYEAQRLTGGFTQAVGARSSIGVISWDEKRGSLRVWEFSDAALEMLETWYARFGLQPIEGANFGDEAIVESEGDQLITDDRDPGDGEAADDDDVDPYSTEEIM